VTDANGCSATQTALVNSVSDITASATVTNDTCGSNNGSINVSVSGGAGGYTFTWSHSATATTPNISALAAGVYSLTITDAEGCQRFLSITVNSSSSMVVVPTAVDASCGGNVGSASVSVTGGTSPYTYLWSNGNTTFQITNIPAGLYSVTVIDANNCQSV